jgi:hypothetical protein
LLAWHISGLPIDGLDRFASTPLSPLAVHETHGRNLILPSVGLSSRCRESIGETVILRPSANRNVPGGVYEVTKQLPHNGHEFEYRIKSSNELHERVAQESELTSA